MKEMSRVRYITYHPFRRWGCPPLSSETPFCCVFGWGESWNSEEETTISTKKHTLREIVGFFGLNKMCGMNQFPMNTLSKVSVCLNFRWILQSSWMTDSRWMWFGKWETTKTDTPTQTINHARQHIMDVCSFHHFILFLFSSKFYCVNNVN